MLQQELDAIVSQVSQHDIYMTGNKAYSCYVPADRGNAIENHKIMHEPYL